MFLNFLRKISCLLFTTRFSKISTLLRNFFSKTNYSSLINDFDGNLKFFCELNEHISSQIFWFGYHSRDELLYLDKILKSNMVFIDVGANRGEFTIFAAKRLENGKIISFEPVTKMFKELKRNVDLNNFKNIKIIKKGAGDKKQQISIYGTSNKFFDNTINEGLFTVYKSADCNKFLEKIDVVVMDEILSKENRIDIIKIDIEGGELPALMGAENIIKKFKPIIILEICDKNLKAAGYNSKNLLNFLKKYNYKFELIIFNGKTKPISVETLKDFQNIVCLPLDLSHN